MSFDWAKAGELAQSPRVAGSAVLGAVFAGVAAWTFWSDIARIFHAIAGSGASVGALTPTFAILVGFFLFVCYSAAFLLISGSAAAASAFRRIGAQRRVRTQELLAVKSQRAEFERSLQSHLLYLSGAEYKILTTFVELASQDPPRDLVGVIRGDEAAVKLARKGFIVPDIVPDELRVLYRLTPAAAAIVPSFLTERRLRMIKQALESAREPERILLGLFEMPDPQSGEPRHSLLENSVYQAIDPLVAAGVLSLATSRIPYILTRIRVSTETIVLAPEAIPFVEELILNAKVSRTSVELDLSLINGTGSSGSGARS